MRAAKIEELARRVFEAYPAGDRQTVEDILAEDFHFTSPYDDAIDRQTYFARCWPNHERMRAIHIHKILVDGETAFVTYELVTKDGRHIHNAEVLQFRGDRLVNVFVHFGAERDAQNRFKPMKQG